MVRDGIVRAAIESTRTGHLETFVLRIATVTGETITHCGEYGRRSSPLFAYGVTFGFAEASLACCRPCQSCVRSGRFFTERR